MTLLSIFSSFFEIFSCFFFLLFFFPEIFSAIPQNLQCHMLSQIAESTTDILERCRLMTLVLQRYPDRVPEQGVRSLSKGSFTLNESKSEFFSLIFFAAHLE